jgi:hypothetical protein
VKGVLEVGLHAASQPQVITVLRDVDLPEHRLDDRLASGVVCLARGWVGQRTTLPIRRLVARG